jgi:octaprenyl-diphosphate synthase
MQVRTNMHNSKFQELNPYDVLKELVGDDLASVNRLILDYANSEVELIPTITNHLTASGGKRLRPLLTLACGKLFISNPDACIRLATAVEFIHTATLLHDDVIDESAKRRGLPTANNTWGNKASILVGDYLLSQSFRLMVEAGSMVALKMLADTALKLTESEVWQLDLIKKVDLSIDDYIKLITGKTAVLFAAACAVSAVVAGKEQKVIDNIYQFGLNLGICFQIIDDLLDYFATSQKFGKSVGGDFFEGKITLPFLVCYQSANTEDKKELYRLIMDDAKDADKVKAVMEYFSKYQTESKCLAIAQEYCSKGEKFISMYAEHPIGKALLDVLQYSASRAS